MSSNMRFEEEQDELKWRGDRSETFSNWKIEIVSWRQRRRLRWKEKRKTTTNRDWWLRWKEKRKTTTSRGWWALWNRLTWWWNRKQFYTFHKDEVITNKQICYTSTELKSQDEADEWNNESESEDEQDYYVTDDLEDQHSMASSEGEMEKMDPLVTMEDDGPLDETLETIEEEFPLDESPRLGTRPKMVLPSPPKRTPLPAPTPPPTPAAPNIYRNGTAESGSLESMDSLVESVWDPEDDASNITPLATNIHESNDAFFVEHVKFLQIQTQPRKVEQVYNEATRSENKELTGSV